MSTLSPRREAFPGLSPWSLLLVLAVLGVCVLGFVWFSSTSALVDEKYHFPQISSFREGVWELDPKLTNIPGYHAVMTAASWLTGADSLNSLRLASLILSLLGLPIVFLVVRKLDPRWATIVTAQYFFFPFLLPYEFLLYTDPLALECTMLSLLLALDDCLWGSALVSIVGVLVRQPQIVWMTLVFVLPYVRKHGLRLEWAAIVEHLRRSWLFLAGFAGFAVFLVVNQGVALGDRSAHPDGGFHLGNILFGLFLCAVVLLPLHVANLPRIVALIRARPWWLLIVAAAFVLCWFQCRFDHPYNTDKWYLRNRLLRATMNLLWVRAGFCAVVALAILSLAVTELKETSFSLLYPFAALNLAPSWLVDVRYVMPAMVLLLLLRVRHSWRLECALLAWFVPLSLFILDSMANNRFFP